MRFELKVTIITVVLTLLSYSGVGCSKEISSTIAIGSKAFPESHLLAEIAAQLLESNGYQVERKFGLGGTLIAFQSLQQDDIQLYPEYTGTLLQTILKEPSLSFSEMQSSLKDMELQVLKPLGFNNSYAIVVTDTVAKQLQLVTIEDLKQHPRLKVGLSLEFLNREDGWPALKKNYQLSQHVKGIEHALAYTALLSKKIDITDAYTTDGKLSEYPLTILKDNKSFFPEYKALYLADLKLPKQVALLLNKLENSLTNQKMQKLNQRHSLTEHTASSVAHDFLLQQGLVSPNLFDTSNESNMIENIQTHTLQHLFLTSSALLAACLFAIPLSLFIANRVRISRTVVYIIGLLQTIPSLALLALMIPLFGLGQFTAIVALFLYSLLPIVRNTITGIETVDPLLKQVAKGMGLSAKQQRLRIELPLAMPSILAGIKTAAIISLGTATLAAFVGAGGLGEPIIAGLTLNDQSLILQGAIPVALLAIVTELMFELIEKKLSPAHLKRKAL